MHNGGFDCQMFTFSPSGKELSKISFVRPNSLVLNCIFSSGIDPKTSHSGPDEGQGQPPHFRFCVSPSLSPASPPSSPRTKDPPTGRPPASPGPQSPSTKVPRLCVHVGLRAPRAVLCVCVCVRTQDFTAKYVHRRP